MHEERLFIINWNGSPLTICEDPEGPDQYCYMMNPYDTVVRFKDLYIRVYDGDKWAYDLGKCYAHIPLQR